MSRTRTTWVDVEVSLDEFSDEDILEEARERRLDPYPECEKESDITEMFYAFKLGREDRAMELARKIAQDHTGGML